MFRLLAVCALLALTQAAQRRYDNFKVYEVTGKTDAEVLVIQQLEHNEPALQLDVWRGAGRDLPAHICVAPKHQEAFLNKLQLLGLEYKLVVENVQNQIDEVDREKASISKSERDITNTYYDLSETENFLNMLANNHPDIMGIGNFGFSREGRSLQYVKLSGERYSSIKPEDSTKPVIWIESTTHAREWITTACTLNLIQWLVDNYQVHSEAQYMLDTFDWFIVPVQNPDGYDWSFTNDRMWRKTKTDGSCFPWLGQGNGVDPNRNWNFQWGGGQTNKCAADYQGPSALSEPCTKALAEKMDYTPTQYRKAFLSLHSYSQMILTPFAYDRYAPVDNYAEQKRVADAAADAIKANSDTVFTVGKPGELLYNAPGGAYDYAHGHLGFEYSLTYELHPASSNPGFQLPPSKIVESFSDFLVSIIAIAQELKL